MQVQHGAETPARVDRDQDKPRRVSGEGTGLWSALVMSLLMVRRWHLHFSIRSSIARGGAGVAAPASFFD
jgi:hypothetical protein